EWIQFSDDFGHHRVVDRKQPAVPIKSVDVSARHVAYIIDVIQRVLRAQMPLSFFVKRAEKVHFDNDPARLGLSEEIAQSLEVRIVPFAQIEFVSSIWIAGAFTAHPGTDKTILCRSERVAGDIERALGLDVSPRESPRTIEFLRCQFVEI